AKNFASILNQLHGSGRSLARVDITQANGVYLEDGKEEKGQQDHSHKDFGESRAGQALPGVKDHNISSNSSNYIKISTFHSLFLDLASLSGDLEIGVLGLADPSAFRLPRVSSTPASHRMATDRNYCREYLARIARI